MSTDACRAQKIALTSTHLIKWWIFSCVILFSQINVTYANEELFAQPTLRAGFHSKSFPDFSLEEIEISVKLLSEEIGREEGIETSVKVYDDLKVMRQDFETGVINFVVASSILFASHFDHNTLSDGFRFVRNSISYDSLILLGQAKSGQANFDNYRGKRLILAESDPLAEIYLDVLSKKHFNQSYAQSFKLIKREKKAHQLILKLYFDQADLTCVYRNAYQVAIEMNPELEKKLIVLSEIEHVPQGMGFFHKKTPEDFRARVIALATKMHERPRGEQLLQLFKSDYAVYTDLNDLAGAISLTAEHQHLFAAH